MTDQPLRLLRDLPGVADLETKALMKPAYREPEARYEFPEIDACSKASFGLTYDEAEEVERPADWDNIERKPIPVQVAAFLLGDAWRFAGLPLGLAYGVGAAWLGCYIAGDHLDRRMPELLAAVTPRR